MPHPRQWCRLQSAALQANALHSARRTPVGRCVVFRQELWRVFDVIDHARDLVPKLNQRCCNRLKLGSYVCSDKKGKVSATLGRNASFSLSLKASSSSLSSSNPRLSPSLLHPRHKFRFFPEGILGHEIVCVSQSLN